jgi:hypothetical protein
MESKYKENRNISVKVSFDLPFCLYLSDNKYEVQMPNYKATILTKQKKHEHVDERLFIEETDLEIGHDRYGRVRYTNAEVTVPGMPVVERDTKERIADKELEAPENGILSLEIDLEDLFKKYSKPALEEALDVINLFLAIYREVTNQFYVRTLSRDDVYKVTIDWYEDNEPLAGTLTVAYGKRGLSPEPSLNPKVESLLRERLMSSLPPSVIAELAMNARDYLELDNYRMALIESRTCVEVLIDRILSGYFHLKSLSIDDAKNILKVKQDVKCESFSDVLQSARLSTKLKNGLKEATGKSLADDADLWGRWLRLKNNRESAVHSANATSEIDAIDGVNTLMDIIDFARNHPISIE